ncbi:hypothetical protein UFOVP903_24 [uncultured Caudovirales phage]|uniref:Uncharacterized protein n=1 Tax=uncultured Caudovirales phage TaxID=2100421 RepID=A0A6J5RVA0_9CAUD|nr:hypothetical protein UFOVP903_24 [uncultured Caudovirales phage]CAB4197548.1 hypothetical protein UFOVP1318_22 [uncultured Caudovirales phage]CAB4210517.1 hypothetical protein UFOVP1430_22 [uncultured Caudovirales phage]
MSENNSKSGFGGAASSGAVEPREGLLQFFDYAHLPAHLQIVSISFYTLAHSIVEKCPRNPERTVALRKLLEAKDCAVRAMIFKWQGSLNGL